MIDAPISAADARQLFQMWQGDPSDDATAEDDAGVQAEIDMPAVKAFGRFLTLAALCELTGHRVDHATLARVAAAQLADHRMGEADVRRAVASFTEFVPLHQWIEAACEKSAVQRLVCQLDIPRH
jgi:hypothetical protein